MDLHAYHRALNLGFSESEASRIGDDAWENNRHQPTCELEPEPDYYDVLVAENTQLRAELANKDQILGDTLAVLCGDGGHYRAEHGDIKAKEHGLKRYHDLLVSEDGLRAELEECKRDAERYRRLCSLVAWGAFGVCRVQSNEEGDDYADDGDMLDAWLDDPEMIAEAQAIDAALAAEEGTK